MVQNEVLVYTATPEGKVVPKTHLKKETSEFDVDSVSLNGGFVLKTKALSLDPYLKGRMRKPEVKSYSPPLEVGKPLETLGVGEVVRSDSPDVKVGSIWRGLIDAADYSVVSGIGLHKGKVIQNEEQLPWTNLVGSVGMPSMTAMVGLFDVGKCKAGETIFISAASGAVGQIACQIAKREGLKVLGSAGSDEKVKHLKEIGVDVAWNYKTEDTRKFLEENPFTKYFDNVGGETLDTVLETIGQKGVIISCGAISQYSVTPSERYRLGNTMQVVAKSIRWEGFIVSNFDTTEHEKTLRKLVKAGDIKIKEHVVDGLDNGEAFRDLLDGTAHGKVVYSVNK
ncbi:MDR family NADP-dependent oxidoreductase [Sporobolomyces salmoneus]|uniref:MDR family NADP-dependent oxidoreductase n=1 Tax=Sporobolomyces salmoneus TaxID=183962 RepID=UPI0031742C87